MKPSARFGSPLPACCRFTSLLTLLTAFMLMPGATEGFGSAEGEPAVPVMIEPPAAETRSIGQTARFRVEAIGRAPLSYQWLFEGKALAGATASALTVSRVQPRHAGAYAVVVTNAVGSITSAVATLTVLPALTAPREQTTPAVAASSNLFLAVWSDRREDDFWDIYGARVSAEGDVLDPDGIPICRSPGVQQFAPVVASDGRDFLVVWVDYRNHWTPEGNTSPDLYATRVTAQGEVLDTNGIPLCRKRLEQFDPAIAFNGTNYLVVWADTQDPLVSGQFDIRAARVTPAGVVLDTNSIAVCTNASNQFGVSVATWQGDFFAAWRDHWPTGGIAGTRIAGAGLVAHPGGLRLSETRSDNAVAVAVNGTGWLIAWDNESGGWTTADNVYGRWLPPGGELANSVALTLCGAAGHQSSPALGSVRDEFLAVWMDAREGFSHFHLRGARIIGNQVTPPDGFVISEQLASGWSSAPAVASLADQSLVVWGARQAISGYSEEIYAARVTRLGQVLDSAGVVVSAIAKRPPVLAWPAPAPIPHGTPLGTNQLNATADVPGTFVYDPPADTLLWAGTHRLRARFAPADSTNNAGATAEVTLQVEPARLIITADDQTRFEGQINPPLTATFAGLVAGDTPELWNDVTILLTTATPDSAPGAYPIDVSPYFNPDNYSVTSVPGTLTVLPARTNAGSVDLQFNAHLEGLVFAVVAQPNGSLLIGGDFTAINGEPRGGIARVTADGRVDEGFAPHSDYTRVVQTIARCPDGRIMIAGFAVIEETHHAYLARLNADGTYDPGFPIVTNAYWDIQSMAVQSDGKVLIAGARHDGNGSGFLFRFNTNGSLDPGFDVGSGPDVNALSSVAVQGDGRILVAGGFTRFNGQARQALVRLESHGAVDPTFVPPALMPSGIASMVLQSDGRMVIGGYALGPGEPGRVARLNPDGALDPSWVNVARADATISTLALQADGRIVLGGAFSQVDGVPRFSLARLNANGSLDLSFDPGEGAHGDEAVVNAIAILSPEFLVVGGAFDTFDRVPRSGLARVRAGSTAPLSWVVRQISGQQVQLLATPPADTSVYAVEDQPPAGWLVTNVTHDGVFDAATGRVKFGPFYDAEPRTVVYQAFPPPGAHGVFTFTGSASADGVNTPIEGDQQRLLVSWHPAECRDVRPANWRMEIEEVTAYGAAWRRGRHWIVPPYEIPMDYVTRAAFLWRGGECYTVDEQFTTAPLWWVNCERVSPAGFASADGEAPPAPTACRSLPPVYIPGEVIQVAIAVSPNAASLAYAVEETLPSGWSASELSDGGELDTVSGTLRWGPFLDNRSRTLRYAAAPPADAAGDASFGGAVSLNGRSVGTAGPSTVRASCRLSVEREAATGTSVVRVHGQSGIRFTVWVSHDLRTWVPLSLTVANGQALEYGPGAFAPSTPTFFRVQPNP